MKKLFLSMICVLFVVVFMCGPAAAKDRTCQLYIDVTWKENLLFDKYNVTLLIDGNEVGSIKYAKPYTNLMKIETGSHTITFCKEDDPDVKGEETVSVSADMTYRCKIQPDGKKVKIISSEQEATLEGSSIEMPDVTLCYASEAVRRLKDAGFVNIFVRIRRKNRSEKILNGLSLNKYSHRERFMIRMTRLS